jgi:hypothetical protein
MAELIHFVAEWAEPICTPHRAEVAQAATQLGWTVRESDIDTEPDLCRQYGVLNVPAVAIEGRPDSVVTGAFNAEDLVGRLSR